MGGWKTLLFGRVEKWEDEKWSKYKFTIMSPLNKIKKVSHFLFKKLCMKYEHFNLVQAKGRWALKKKKKEVQEKTPPLKKKKKRKKIAKLNKKEDIFW